MLLNKLKPKVFSISIDELLSGEELIAVAETENRSSFNKIYGLIYGVLDFAALAFIFVPLFGRQDGNYIRAVTLFAGRMFLHL